MNNDDDNTKREDESSQGDDAAQEEKQSFLGKVLSKIIQVVIAPFVVLWYIVSERAIKNAEIYKDTEFGGAASFWSFLFCPALAAEVGYNLGWLQHWDTWAWVTAAAVALPAGYYFVWPRLWKSLVLRAIKLRRQADSKDENGKERWLNNVLSFVSHVGVVAGAIAAGFHTYSLIAMGGGPVQWFTQVLGVLGGFAVLGISWSILHFLVETFKLHVLGVATAVALVQQLMPGPTAAFLTKFNMDQHLAWTAYALEFFTFYGIIQPRLRMLVERTFAFLPELSKKVCDVMYEEKDEKVRKFFLDAANIGTSVHVGMASQGLWAQASNPLVAQYGLPTATGLLCYLILGTLFNGKEGTRDSAMSSLSVIQSLHAAFTFNAFIFAFTGGVQGTTGTLISVVAAAVAGIASYTLVIPGLYTLARPTIVALSKLRVLLVAGPTFAEVMEKMWRKSAQFIDFVIKSYDLFMKDESKFATIVAQSANISTTAGLYSVVSTMTGPTSWQSILTALVAYTVGGKLFMRSKTKLANTIWSIQLGLAAGATAFAGAQGNNQLLTWLVTIVSAGLSFAYVVPAAAQATKLAMLKVLGEKGVAFIADAMEGVWRAAWNITKIIRTAFFQVLGAVRAAFNATYKAVRAAFKEVGRQWKIIQKKLAKIFGKNKDKGSNT